jgi:hypothetical protein
MSKPALSPDETTYSRTLRQTDANCYWDSSTYAYGHINTYSYCYSQTHAYPEI